MEQYETRSARPTHTTFEHAARELDPSGEIVTVDALKSARRRGLLRVLQVETRVVIPTRQFDVLRDEYDEFLTRGSGLSAAALQALSVQFFDRLTPQERKAPALAFGKWLIFCRWAPRPDEDA